MQLVHEEGGDAVITIGNPTAVVDRSNGRVWLAMNRKNHDTLIAYSDDDGVSWAPVKDITASVRKSDWGWYALGPGVGIQLERGSHRGRLLIPANHRETKNRSGPSASHVIYSDDHGATWRIGGTYTPTNANWLKRSPTTNTVADKYAQPLGAVGEKPELAGCRLVSRSHDGGITWSTPTRDEQLIEPTCQASLLRWSWPSPTERSVLLFANPDHASKRIRTTVRASFDEGRTWPQSRLIDAGASGYTCIPAVETRSVCFTSVTATSGLLSWTLALLCQLSVTDARYAKYPPQPVLQCDGHQPPA